MTADLLHLGPLPPLSRDLLEPDDVPPRRRLLLELPDPAKREKARRRREAELERWMRKRLS